MATDNAQQQDPKMNELIVVEKIEGWEKLKALVLDSVSSPIRAPDFREVVPRGWRRT
jgi:hypothetical protein